MANGSFVLAGWVPALKHTLDASGVDSDKIFLDSGISTDNLHGAGDFIARDNFEKLLEKAVSASRNPAIGIQVARQISPLIAERLALGCLLAKNVDEAIDHFIDHHDLVASVGNIKKITGSITTEIRIDDLHLDHSLPKESYDLMLASLLVFIEISMGVKLNVAVVKLRRPRPVKSNEFYNIFGENILFYSDRNSLVIYNESLESHRADRDISLEHHLTKNAVPLVRNSIKNPFESKVMECLIGSLHKGVASQTNVAHQLNMSVSNIQRKLREEGTNFQSVLEHTRMLVSVEYLKNSGVTVGQVAELLGFRSTSNFSRAFKQWYGLSPSHYKLMMLERLEVSQTRKDLLFDFEPESKNKSN